MWIPLLTLNSWDSILSSYSVLQGSSTAFHTWLYLYNPCPGKHYHLVAHCLFEAVHANSNNSEARTEPCRTKVIPCRTKVLLIISRLNWCPGWGWSGSPSTLLSRAATRDLPLGEHKPGCSLQSILHTHPAATTVHCGPAWAALSAAPHQGLSIF